MNLTRLYADRICPACGFKLDFTPWEGNKIQERPCPSCGLFFGFDDIREDKREEVYLIARKRWIENGKRWWSKPPAPTDYNPDQQLANLARLENEFG